jgi:hypothetical protein
LIPEEVLEVREKQLRNREVREYMVKWKNLPIQDATWENEQVLQQAGAKLLVGKQFPVGERLYCPPLLERGQGGLNSLVTLLDYSPMKKG